MKYRFRPWGPFDWVLGKLKVATWSFLGCIATEERCLSAWEILNTSNPIALSQFVDIYHDHWRFTELANERKAKVTEGLLALGSPTRPPLRIPLLATHNQIVQIIEDTAQHSNGNLILDITCFPKRFFFPFLRRLLDSELIKNLLVTYSVPEKYYSGVLAEDHQPLAHIPLFAVDEFPMPVPEMIVIGIGYVPLGIVELIRPEYQNVKVKLLFPFPPGPPHAQRNWKFVGELHKTLASQSHNPVRVEAYDVSDTFDHLCNFTHHGESRVALAPYGPKSMSLAMCLYARLTRSPVYYTQPKFYHPEYTTGIARSTNGVPISYCYCVRLDGNDVFELPS